MTTFEEWFERKYPKRVYGEDAELVMMRSEYGEVWDAAVATAYKRGDRVLVAWQSGHLEECTVEETTVWVKDYTGHSHECTLGQISKITESHDAAPSVPEEKK